MIKRAEIIISGISDEARAILGNKPIRIRKLPYVVGRSTGNTILDLLERKNLILDDTVPYNVSRKHFAIIKEGKDFRVVDQNSTLGTIVNGKPIGKKMKTNSVQLHKGDNEIIVGNQKSPYIFSIHLSEKKQVSH